uniref:Ppx/GppA phosphatase N-terminal domain-containing protein n=1 Tax=Magnetococcus massalia (strain MO-1) TaxID=451514 RepID=A0A1S7LFG8_MAGMO|nr:Exported protein of unknown function [Candidatus Magnetococcus massalia]
MSKPIKRSARAAVQVITMVVSLLALLSSDRLHAQHDQLEERCLRTRTAYDLGSGTTKVQVAKVDVCRGVIVESLYRKAVSVSYQQDLGVDGKRFSPEILAQGMQTLQMLGEKAKASKGAADGAAVATAAYRQATDNAQQQLNRLAAELNIHGVVITQRQEAINGFLGVAARTGIPKDQLVVWDIGGGSMQITLQDRSGAYHIYQGPFGAVNFRDYVIKEIKGKPLKTPNPMTKAQLNHAVSLSEGVIGKLPKAFLAALIDKQQSQWVGIGGVHNFSVSKSVGGIANYTLTGLRSSLLALADRDDAALGGGKFVSTKVTDIALVLGYFKRFALPALKIIRVDNTDAVLTMDKHWLVVNNDAASITMAEKMQLDLLANDRSQDGKPLTVSALSSAQHGHAKLEGGVLHYRPSPTFFGNEVLTYTATDGILEQQGAVSITVTRP